MDVCLIPLLTSVVKIGAASIFALSEVPASMQEHCVAALLRLHKRQIMRLRSPEDFIQVQPNANQLQCTTNCYISIDGFRSLYHCAHMALPLMHTHCHATQLDPTDQIHSHLKV